MENKEKTYGQLMYEFYWENYEDSGSWEKLNERCKENFERAGNKLIQYYEDYLLREFLDKNKDDN